jgi:AraC-like DNA-binding protein
MTHDVILPEQGMKFLKECDSPPVGRLALVVAPSDAASRSILRPRSALQHFVFHRYPAPATLADLVDHFWTVTWDLPPGQTYTAQTLPGAAVNLTVTNTEANVTGVVRRRYERQLRGSGYAVGARFRPACFRPWVDGPVSRLTDTHRPIAEVLDRETTLLAQQVAAEAEPLARVALLADFLTVDRPAPDATAARLADLVDTVSTSPTLTRVGQLAYLAGVSIRSLQREFVDYVGAGPKWVIQRYRLLDVAARAASEAPVDWAEVAATLGFADQAHLIRAFTATVGEPPATYARLNRADGDHTAPTR